MKSRRTRTLQSAKYLEKKRKKQVLRYALISTAIVLIIIVIVSVLNISAFRISEVNISGVKTLEAKDIEKIVIGALSGKKLGIIPNNSTVFYSRDNIEDAIESTYKRVQNIEINKEGLQKLNIIITENVPEAIVCEGFREEENQEKCFFLDKKAYVFDKASQISDGVYIKYYTGHEFEDISIGKNFIDSGKFNQLQGFVESIKGFEVPIGGVLVGKDGNYELYIRNRDQTITVIYFDDRTPFDKTASNFLAFWQSVIDKKIGTSTIPIFDYINLKFGNNIFYTTR